MSVKIITSNQAKKNATRIVTIEKQIATLRKPVVDYLRETVKANLAVLSKINNKQIRWMVDKVQRGYFGTDVRSAQMSGLITELEKALS